MDEDIDETPATSLTASTVLALMVGTAFAATLDRAGTWSPTASHEQNATRGTENLVNDGSFRAGSAAGFRLDGREQQPHLRVDR
ncbi:MAG: hypothetical protein R3E97_14730 [Candidatus Eisenbacteria bacterium]